MDKSTSNFGHHSGQLQVHCLKACGSELRRSEAANVIIYNRKYVQFHKHTNPPHNHSPQTLPQLCTYSSMTLANFSIIFEYNSSYFFVILSCPSLGTSNFMFLSPD